METLTEELGVVQPKFNLDFDCEQSPTDGEEMNGFLLDDTLTDLRTRVRTFVDDNVIPQEAVIERENAEGRRDTLTAIQERVKSSVCGLHIFPKSMVG